MLQQIQVCDVCGVVLGEETKTQDHRVSFWEDRKMDPAGSMDDEYQTGHLCFHCLRQLVYRVAGLLRGTQLDKPLSVKFAETFKAMVRKKEQSTET